jgi:hypothetical protein
MKRDNFSEMELREIWDVLGCDVKIVFVDSRQEKKLDPLLRFALLLKYCSKIHSRTDRRTAA